MAAEPEPLIGIDLGTTNSVVATVQDGQPIVIKNRTGQHLTPSVVAVSKNGKRLVGQIAKRQAITNPQETVYAAKRLIGRKFSSPQVQEALQVAPVPGGVRRARRRARPAGRQGRLACPRSAPMMLRGAEGATRRRTSASRSPRRSSPCPPTSTTASARPPRTPGRIAGLDVLRIINEPTAAALAYGFGKHGEREDRRASTWAAAPSTSRCWRSSNGVFEVLATGGDTFLGGEDFDNRIIEWLVFGFAKEHGIDLRKDRMALQRLKDAAEKAKFELSTREGGADQPALHLHAAGRRRRRCTCRRTLTREKLEELTADLVRARCIGICDAGARARRRCAPADLKEVILVGGMTRMPRIVEAGEASTSAASPARACTRTRWWRWAPPSRPHALISAAERGAAAGRHAAEPGRGHRRRLRAAADSAEHHRAHLRHRGLHHLARTARRTVKIMVLQGESELAHQNELLGEFILTGLREAPRGRGGDRGDASTSTPRASSPCPRATGRRASASPSPSPPPAASPRTSCAASWTSSATTCWRRATPRS